MREAIRDPSLNRARVQENAKKFLREAGFRITAQRSLILEEIFASREHFSAEELIARLQKRGRKLSISTVYRILSLLSRHDLLGRIEDARGRRKFDPNTATEPGHFHIACSDCGKIIEFEDPCMGLRERALLEKMGFSASKLSVTIEARCKHREENGRCCNDAS